VPLFDQFGENALVNFMPEYLIPEIEYSNKFVTNKEDPDHPASTHLLSIRGLLTSIGTQGTTPIGLERLKDGSASTQPTTQEILEDHGLLIKA
jgi:hypothetical protein